MRVALGADHGGFILKKELAARLSDNYDISDLGAFTLDPADDYPDFAEAVARSVASGKVQRGIIICGSGVGACVTANKIRGIRACNCQDIYSAHQGVEHDDMNVICLGTNVIGQELAFELVTAFLKAKFSGEERHSRRLAKILAIEQQEL